MDISESNSRATDPVSISVVICTRNRAESLRITLEHLAVADRSALTTEVIVVDNGGSDRSRDVSLAFADRIAIRYLYEPTQGVYGKSHALNRALNEVKLGFIVAVLDDDISVRADWFQAVAAICRRWPHADVFTGNTVVVWPNVPIPNWATSPAIRSGVLSCVEWGECDLPLREGQWFPGGHFWFRSRVLASGRRFRDIWLTEPDFQLDLLENGSSGIASGEAVAGHRIQPQLLVPDVALDRARLAAQIAWLRLRPFRRSVRQAVRFNQHPLLARAGCVLNYLRWRLVYGVSSLAYSTRFRRGFPLRVLALERMSIAREYLRAARGMKQYACRRSRSAAEDSTSRPSISGFRAA